MAKVIQDERKVVVEPWWAKGSIAYIGLGLGLLWWIVTALLSQYVIEPLACRNLSSATACIDAQGVAGNVTMILVAVIGMALLVRSVQPRPIIISLGTAVVLWGLGSILGGLTWWSVLLWSLFFFAVSYGLFGLISRIKWLWVSLVVAVAVAVGIRFLLAL